MDRPHLLPLALALAFALALGCSDGKKGPSAPVDLLTDNLGITHVYAHSDADAFFGAGYAQARDRLFQMDLWRRRALGTQAEVLGAAFLADDQQARVMGFGTLGLADWALMQKERSDEAGLLTAWCAGVNRFIDEVAHGRALRPYGLGPGELDYTPAPFAPEHALAIGKVLSFGLSNTLDQDLLATALMKVTPTVARALPLSLPTFDVYTTQPAMPTPHAARPASAALLPANTTGSLPPAALPSSWRQFATITGSNNWAVDGMHSDNGRPLLAGDPHQALTSPSRFWPVHMSSVDGGGSLDVIGFAFPGTPAVELGHNAHIGWTATTNFADVMDLFDVPVQGDFATAMLGDGAHPIVARNEAIVVRDPGMPAGKGHTEMLTVHAVPGYGVFLPDEILPIPSGLLVKGGLLFNWTGFQPTRESSAYLALDRARDLDGFEQAADLLDVGAVNFVAADQTGIDYHVHAIVPDRGDPKSRPMPWHVVDGSDAANLWTHGTLAAERLPRLRAPATGYIVTANNDPFGFTADGNVENDPYYYGAFFANGQRAQRIAERLIALTGRGHVTRDEMAALQDDVHSSMADTLLPPLHAAVTQIGTNPAFDPWKARAADLTALDTRLQAWLAPKATDPLVERPGAQMRRDSRDALVFLGFEWFATRRAFGTQLPPQLFAAVAAKSPPYLLGMLQSAILGRFDASSFLPGGKAPLLLDALGDTADWLKATYGSLDGSYTLASFSGAAWPNEYGHRLDGAWLPIDGASDTVFVDEAAFFAGDAPVMRMSANEVSLYRMAVGFDADGTPAAVLDFARGASGEPDSPHFADQEPGWQAGQHVPLPFRHADVTAAMTAHTTLE